MNKKTIIIGAVGVVFVAIAVVVATQWARLKTVASVAQNATMNEEQVTAKSSENEQIVQELEHDFRIPTIELTPEMEAAIADGSMSLEEAASQFLTAPDSAAVSEPAAESDAAPATDTATSPEPVTTPDMGTTTEPVAQPEPEPAPAPVAQPEPEPAPAAKPEPEPTTPAPVSTPEPAPVTTPEPEPTAQLSGVTEAPQEDTEAPQQNTVAPEPEAPQQNTAAPEPEAPQQNTAAPEPEAPQQNTAAPEPEAPQQSAADKAKAEQEARVQNLFAQLYVLRASFNTQLDNLIGECIQEFLALDPASQTRAAKIRIVYARMDDVTAMEADCDAQVESIAAQLDEIDPALGTKARQYYKNEKDLKKASLIETYGK